MAELVHIVSATSRNGHTLALRFSDGSTGEVDVARHVSFDGIFAALADEAYFHQVRVDPELGTVVWPNGADIDPIQLRIWAGHPPLDRVQEGSDLPWDYVSRPILIMEAFRSALLLSEDLERHPARWRPFAFAIRDGLGHLLSHTMVAAHARGAEEREEDFDIRHGLATFSELIDYLTRNRMKALRPDSAAQAGLRSLDVLCERSIDQYPAAWSVDRDAAVACCHTSLAFGQHLLRAHSLVAGDNEYEAISAVIDQLIAALPMSYENTTRFGVS